MPKTVRALAGRRNLRSTAGCPHAHLPLPDCQPLREAPYADVTASWPRTRWTLSSNVPVRYRHFGVEFAENAAAGPPMLALGAFRTSGLRIDEKARKCNGTASACCTNPPSPRPGGGERCAAQDLRALVRRAGGDSSGTKRCNWWTRQTRRPTRPSRRQRFALSGGSPVNLYPHASRGGYS